MQILLNRTLIPS